MDVTAIDRRAAALNASCAAAVGDVFVIADGRPAPPVLAWARRAFGDPHLAAATDGDAVAVRAELWRARPFRPDLRDGAIAEWAAYWRERGWRTEAIPGAPVAPLPPPGPVAVLVDRFPELSETFVANEVRALARAGHAVAIEARWRGEGDPTAPCARSMEDETRSQRLRAVAWLLARHPIRCAQDLARRRRWAREEVVTPLRRLAPRARRLRTTGHLHAHFAYEAALDAVRLGRLLDLPVSVTAHAADIYVEPHNLRTKVTSARFATSGCDSTVDHLRALAGPGHAGAVHKVVMGVDGDAFKRTTPHPAGRHVLAIGRLVEKKGFVDLVRAAALAGDITVTIIGEGRERPALEREIAELDLTSRVTLAGARPPRAVREALESADLLCAPCVIARDGDRDSMPVAVKEALAMEVCVVATAVAGLPEIVRAPWGRLTAPGDPQALATAIDDLLATPSADRAQAGRAGRAFVLEHANVDTETAKLSMLIRASASATAPPAAAAARRRARRAPPGPAPESRARAR